MSWFCNSKVAQCCWLPGTVLAQSVLFIMTPSQASVIMQWLQTVKGLKVEGKVLWFFCSAVSKACPSPLYQPVLLNALIAGLCTDRCWYNQGWLQWAWLLQGAVTDILTLWSCSDCVLYVNTQSVPRSKHSPSRSTNNQHYALTCTAALFYTLAPTCSVSSLPSSGSFLDHSELLEIQIGWVVYHIMCGYVTCVLECCGSILLN
jgi:hypothetical protein